MTRDRPAWIAPVAVGVVGLGATTAVAAAGGVDTSDTLHLVLYSAGGAAVAGIVAVMLLRASRRRSITLLAIVAALAPVLATAIGVIWAASEMFLMTHDLVVLGVVLVAAGTVAVIIALTVGRSVARTSAEVTGMARRLTEVGHVEDVTAGNGPVELAALARELETTSARLREARSQAEATERSRRELVAWVSHDLRTPLAGIRAMIEALEDGVVTDTDTVDRYHATIGLETERLSCLVDALFELSRIQAGALRLDTESVPLDELIRDAVDASRPGAGNVQLVVCSDDPAPVVEMSPSEMVRVVRNLIDNAVRHTPGGGQVVVAAGSDRHGAWLAVSDGCGGIPAADLPRVFETGYRGDTARTPGDGRGGLGLAVAQGLVDAHGGRIEVRNVGPGCRFTVRLPWDATTRPTRAASGVVPSGGGSRISGASGDPSSRAPSSRAPSSRALDRAPSDVAPSSRA
jgi:signal transduction histidine kinase